MTGSAADPAGDRAPDSHPGLPRWVRLLVIVGLVAVAVMVLGMVLLGGDHGPGRHG